MPPFKRNSKGECVFWCPREEVPIPKAVEAPKAIKVSASANELMLSQMSQSMPIPLMTAKTASNPTKDAVNPGAAKTTAAKP
jgi:hypothetical protein